MNMKVDELNDKDSVFNERMFSDILKLNRVRHTGIKVSEVITAVPKGTNYLSELYRVRLKVAESYDRWYEMALIVKTFPKGKYVTSYMKKEGIFEKELHTYEYTLPKMYEIVSKNFDNQSLTFAPLHFACPKRDMIILQDLLFTGYKMGDRLVGLNLEHCVCAIKALARFHAISVALKAEHIESMDVYREKSIVEEKKDLQKHFIAPNFICLAKEVEKWSGFERFGDKLRRISNIVTDKIIQLMKPNSFLSVLNHGDFWVNNLLFSYAEDGRIRDVKFIDFQYSRYVSPALDLHCFLCTSPSLDVRLKGSEALIEEYYKEFCYMLKKLNRSTMIFSLDQLNAEINDKSFFGIYILGTLLGLVLVDPQHAPNYDDLSEQSIEEDDASLLKNRFSSVFYRRVSQMLLIEFENQGLL